MHGVSKFEIHKKVTILINNYATPTRRNTCNGYRIHRLARRMVFCQYHPSIILHPPHASTAPWDSRRARRRVMRCPGTPGQWDANIGCYQGSTSNAKTQRSFLAHPSKIIKVTLIQDPLGPTSQDGIYNYISYGFIRVSLQPSIKHQAQPSTAHFGTRPWTSCQDLAPSAHVVRASKSAGLIWNSQ